MLIDCQPYLLFFRSSADCASSCAVAVPSSTLLCKCEVGSRQNANRVASSSWWFYSCQSLTAASFSRFRRSLATEPTGECVQNAPIGSDKIIFAAPLIHTRSRQSPLRVCSQGQSNLISFEDWWAVELVLSSVIKLILQRTSIPDTWPVGTAFRGSDQTWLYTVATTIIT